MDKSILKQCASLKREYVDEEKRIQEMDTEIQAMAPICKEVTDVVTKGRSCLLYTSPSPRDYAASRMPSSA